MPSRVLADVYYSHGYYLYEENKFRKAAQLFTKSIQTLEDIHEEWDAPYIRLAIIKLGSKNVKDKDYSYDLFSKSRIICDHTDCTKNRESKLGLALCTLGLNIIDIIKEKPLSNYDAIGDLEKGILFEPPLSIGALKCHLHDAKNLDEIIKNNLYPGNFKIVEDFIALLEKEIKTTTNKNTACKSTTCLDQTSSSSCPNK